MHKPFQFIGLMSLAFGVLVIVLPQLVNTLIGIFFIVIGVNFLMLSRNNNVS